MMFSLGFVGGPNLSADLDGRGGGPNLGGSKSARTPDLHGNNLLITLFLVKNSVKGRVEGNRDTNLRRMSMIHTATLVSIISRSLPY